MDNLSLDAEINRWMGRAFITLTALLPTLLYSSESWTLCSRQGSKTQRISHEQTAMHSWYHMEWLCPKTTDVLTHARILSMFSLLT